MAVFERHFASEPFTPQRFPRAPVRELADTGQGLEAQALAGLGRGLTETAAVLFKWNQREGNSQYDTSRGEAQNLIGEFERTSFADSAGHDAAFKKLESKIAKSAGKNRSGARKFKQWIKTNKAALDKMSGEKKIRMIARNNQVALFQNLSNVARQTDSEKAMAEIDTLIKGGLDDGSIKTAAQALALKERFTEDWLRSDVWRKATTVTRPDGEVDWQAAAEWFDVKENIAGLPENIVEDFANTARAQARSQNAEDIEKTKNEQEGQRLEIVKELRPGGDMKEASRLVATSKLSATEQEMWDRKIEARATAINSGKDDPMNQTTPAKYFELRRKIETKPGSVTEADLAAAVGEGISITDYETLLGMVKDKDDPLNEKSATRAQMSIGRLRDAEVDGLPTPEPGEGLQEIRDIEAKYLRISNEYDAYLISEEGRKATDKQKEEKLRALMEPEAKAVTLHWFEEFVFAKRATPFFGRIGTTEERQLAQKRIKTFRKSPEFERFTETEQQQVIDLIESGLAIERAVSQIETPLPKPKTQAEFNAIPSGTEFIDTDGVRKIKQ